jgi:hypothetical protein
VQAHPKNTVGSSSSVFASSSAYSSGSSNSPPVVTISNCVQSSGNGQCIVCNSGYMINSQGVCILSTGNQGITTLPFNFNSQTASVGGNGLISTEQHVESHSSWPSGGSASSAGSAFASSQSSYSVPPFNQNGPFVPPSPQMQTLDPNCFQYSGSQCVTCSKRFYFDATGVCIPINPQC